jgi:hypothetical protein
MMAAAAAVGGGGRGGSGNHFRQIWSQMHISLFFVRFLDNFKFIYHYS